MSPRGGKSSGGSSGGSRGGSGGGGSGTGYSSGGYSEPSLWTRKIQLVGSHFTDGEVTASIVINLMCLVALIGIAIWSTRIRTNVHSSLKVFKWFGLGIALTANIIVWTLSIINSFLSELRVEVTNLYIIMNIIIVFFSFISDLSLIIVIFTIISFRIKSFYSFRVQNGLVIVRCLILSTQLTLFIASLSYFIRGEVRSVETEDDGYEYLSKYADLLTGFRIVFFLISLLVLSNSVIIFIRSRKVSIPSKVPSRIVLLIATPLFVRSFVDLILAILLNLVGTDADHRTVDLIQTIFVTIPTVIIFFGIVLIGINPDLSALNQDVLDTAFTTPAQAILPGLGSRVTLASSDVKHGDEEQYAEFSHPMPPPSHAEKYKIHQSQQSWTQPLAWNQTPPLPQEQVFEAPSGAHTPPNNIPQGGQAHEVP